MSKKTISFLSNTITHSFTKYFNKDFYVIHHNLDSIIETLNSKTDTDYLIVILDNKFFFENFVIKSIAFEIVEFLSELLKVFRKQNNAKILISNIAYDFIDINSALNIEEYKNLILLNEKIEELSNQVADLAILNIFNLANRIGFNHFFSLSNSLLFQAPFTKEAIKLITSEIKKKIDVFNSLRKKVVLLDLDNTLWGGIVGEDGFEGIKIDENYPGIAYKYFQNQMKYLKKSGIVLCIVSKNNFAEIEDLFNNQDMPLKWNDFVIKKINWQNKSQNIIEIANELNVGIDSMIFFDDSHFEINLVKDTLENIDVIKLDSNNPINNLGIIERLPFLNSIKITIEDENKSSQYLSEQKRITIRKTTATVDDFIESLEINISYWINNKSQLARITQLVNKTNQFNLTTKRYSESEISHFMNFNQVFSFQIKDKFGDMGITAVVIVIDNKIDTFLMSCRILGRKIEEKIMKIILNQTTKPLSAEYIRTSKNSQVENLYDKFGFRLVSKDKSKNVYILEMQ
ncbi:MAG: hypothetical protein DRQ57_00345 [Gammaproteobacteria bacterium]|nr:MAG: hypothetical protein DRQ57_00345 [Gammaproteobacteria bacterium]